MRMILWTAAAQVCRLALEACGRRADTHDRHPIDLIREAWVAR